MLSSAWGLAGDAWPCAPSTSPVLVSGTCPYPAGCARHMWHDGEKTTHCLKRGAWGQVRKTLLVAVLKACDAQL